MKDLYLYVRGSSFNDVHSTLSLAAAHIGNGGKVHLYLTWASLAAFCSETLDDLPIDMLDEQVRTAYQRAVDRGSIPEPGVMLGQLREQGSIQIYGCSTSVRTLRLEAEAIARLDAVLTHQSFLEMSGKGRLLVV